MKTSKYIWGKKIGEGGTGTVYICADKRNPNQLYAGKVIPMEVFLENEQYILREVDLLRKMSICENSVQLIDAYEENDDFIIIMELCDTDLREIYNWHREPFSPKEIFEIFHQLNKAFALMQQFQIIHRDLKLENILIKFVDREKMLYIPKLSDYGFGRRMDRGPTTSSQVGTPYTVAPEIMNGTINYDSKCDIWSIGCMMYHMMTLEYPPFMYKIYYSEASAIRDKLELKPSPDPLLNDLLRCIFVINPRYRIGWGEYFAHPFFRQFEQLRLQYIPPIPNRNVLNDKIIQSKGPEFISGSHNHPLYYIKVKSFECNECKMFFENNYVYRCEQCSFNMCQNCFAKENDRIKSCYFYEG